MRTYVPCKYNIRFIYYSEMALSAIASLTRFATYYSSSSSLTFKYLFSRRIIFTVSANKRQQKQQSCRIMASSTISLSPGQDKIAAPYGSWKSPITADVVSGASKRLGGTAVDSHGHLVWLESRPNESGYTQHAHLTYLIKI